MPDATSLIDEVERETKRVLARPGTGSTMERWTAFADLARRDLALAKLVEPHHDAAAILSDLGLPAPAPGSIWAVWAAEPPFARVEASPDGDAWELSGTKAFCSGGSFVSDALLTADSPDGVRLFSIDVAAGRADGAILVDPPTWVGGGMRSADTRTLHLTRVRARAAGGPRAYLDRPGFWHGAVGIAACWYGGAEAVAEPLRRSAQMGRLDPHGKAHLGAVTAVLDAAYAQLTRTAAAFDDDPDDDEHRAERLALSVRATVADAVEQVITHVGRALGPAPLAFDAEHAQRVADLQVFVRQHHAERDLAALGALVGNDGHGD